MPDPTILDYGRPPRKLSVWLREARWLGSWVVQLLFAWTAGIGLGFLIWAVLE